MEYSPRVEGFVVAVLSGSGAHHVEVSLLTGASHLVLRATKASPAPNPGDSGRTGAPGGCVPVEEYLGSEAISNSPSTTYLSM